MELEILDDVEKRVVFDVELFVFGREWNVFIFIVSMLLVKVFFVNFSLIGLLCLFWIVLW